MAQKQKLPEIVSRPTVIAALREELARRAGGEVSICRLAAEKGLFCRGFKRLSDAELRERYDWIQKKDPSLTRAELENVADRWQLARQEVFGAKTSCDVQQLEHDACGGWDDFNSADLARFLRELTGRVVEVS